MLYHHVVLFIVIVLQDKIVSSQTTSYDYGTSGTSGTYTTGTYPYWTSTDYPTTADTSGISAVSDLLHLLPLLHIPIKEYVTMPGTWEDVIISSDNILHDVTISYKGSRYNVLMEDVASIISIPQTLRNVKVFHHEGIKHFRIDHRDGKLGMTKKKKLKDYKKTQTKIGNKKILLAKTKKMWGMKKIQMNLKGKGKLDMNKNGTTVEAVEN
eukprot:GFUD01119178.1.p1 GENE.GFUD01119178.1~~GFUD01119178.1.p1  ORF type:complete len:218 (+),score=51.24 GFUD01119178.1:24-656(+)